jgi:opacity protein-like surface antigen
MRKLVLIAVTLSLFGALAVAQVPTSGNVFLGYSFYNTDLSSIDRANTNGWEASVEGKVLPFIGIVADFDAHYGSQNFEAGICPAALGGCFTQFNANLSEHNYLFGPRASFSIGKIRPFAEVLIGAGHVQVNGVASDTSFATAVGGGVDYKLFHLLAWRLQGDYIHTSFFSTPQNNVRLSTGIVFRF